MHKYLKLKKDTFESQITIAFEYFLLLCLLFLLFYY